MIDPKSSVLDNRYFAVPLRDWTWLFALGLLRFLIGLHYGLGVDEAHYALYGLHLDWSYFDDTPLVGWVQAIFLHLFGLHDWVVHLPAEIAGVVSGLLAFRLCEKLTGDVRAARWGAIALSVSFLPNGLWFMLEPDTLLLIFVFWLCEIVIRLRNSGYRNWREWCELGLCLGLCGLSKYTAIILVPGLLLFSLWERNYREIKDHVSKFLAAVVIASIIVSPVFYWNAIHGWISFHYQISHVVYAHRLSLKHYLKNFVSFIGVQTVAYSPFVIAAAAIGWWRWKRNFSEFTGTQLSLGRLILSLALTCLAFFAYTSSRQPGLPHWTFFAWGLLLPAGVSIGAAPTPSGRRAGVFARGLTVVSSLVVGVLFFELAFHVIHYPPYRSPYNDFAGWQELRPTVKKLVAEECENFRIRPMRTKAAALCEKIAIGVPNWTLGSRAMWYYSGIAPVYVLDNKFDQFNLWEGNPPIGKDLLILQWRGFPMKLDQKSKCTSIQPIGTKVFSEHGIPITSVKLWWCLGYK